MSTYRYRGDLRTTGDQLRLRDGGTGTSSSVEIKAGATAEGEAGGVDVVISTPPAPVDKDDVNITADVMVLEDTKQTLSAKTVDLTDNTILGTLAEFNEALEDDDFVGLAAEQTLTNKTLTSPVINSPTVDGLIIDDNQIVFEGATQDDYELTLTVEDPIADATVTIPATTDTLVARDTTDTLTNKTINLANNTLSGTFEQFNTALSDYDEFVARTSTQALENKELSHLTFTQQSVGATLDGSTEVSVNKVFVEISSASNSPKIASIDTLKTQYIIFTNKSGVEVQLQNGYSTPSANYYAINTGTGGDVALPNGASLALIFDPNTQVWRPVGGVGGEGGLTLEKVANSNSPVTAEVGKHYLVDTTLGVVVINLPDSSSLTPTEKATAIVRISDIGENSETNNITINRGGTSDLIKLDGKAAEASLTFDVNGTWIQLALDGTTWHVDDVFWNVVAPTVNPGDYVSASTSQDLAGVDENKAASRGALSSIVYTKSQLDGGQLDNRYYTESEINDFLSSNASADRNRANHTGTQLASTIFQFGTEVANTTAVAANTAKVSADGSINTHNDVDTTTTSPNTGEALVWSGTVWAPGDVSSVTAKRAILKEATSGHGSSAFNIRYFTSVGQVNEDTNVFTITNSSSAGTSITVLEDGLYFIEYTDWSSSDFLTIGVSVGAALSDQQYDIETLPDLWAIPPVSSNVLWSPITASGVVKLSANAVLRPHTNRAPDGEDSVLFRVTQISKL